MNNSWPERVCQLIYSSKCYNLKPLLIVNKKALAHISTFLFNIDMSKGCNIY